MNVDVVLIHCHLSKMKQHHSSKKPRRIPLRYTMRAAMNMIDKISFHRVSMTFDKEFKCCHPSSDFSKDKWQLKSQKLMK